VIGGTGGNVIRECGPIVEKQEKNLSPAALRLRKLRRALSRNARAPLVTKQLEGQEWFK
jgi:hypothetical protein